MLSGIEMVTSPSIVRVPASTCSLSLSLGTPGRSARSVMPLLSSITSTGGIRAVSLRCTGSLRVAASVREACSFLVTAVVSFMVESPRLLDGDAAWLGRFVALHVDVQHAVAIVGRDAIGIDVVGQAHHPPEPATETFVYVHGGFTIVTGRQVRGPLASDSQQAAVQMHFHRGGIEPRSEGVDFHGLWRAADV